MPHKSHRLVVALATCALGVALLVPGGVSARDNTDARTIQRVRAEGFERSHVMKTLRYLTDVIGARLTGSPAMKRANEWTMKTLRTWGLKNAHLEEFEFGRGWSFSRATVHMVKPTQVPLTALPKAWSPGTPGAVRGAAMMVDIETAADLERFRGKVRGKVLFMDESVLRKPNERPFLRYSAKELAELGTYPDDMMLARPGGQEWKRRRRKQWKLRKQLSKFLAEEKPVALVYISSRDANLVRVMGYTYRVGETTPVPELVMAGESYNRVVRQLEDGQAVELEIDVRAMFHDGDRYAYNTIAEIPGTSKRGEIVMVGAHLDSWHGGTGAVDNGAGVAIVMEAVRILAALKIRPKRTIRIALWSGEEQGLLGSKAYVARHFATRPEPKDPEQRALPRWLRDDPGWPIRRKPAYAKLSAYFNIDNGSGRIRGIWAENNAAARPIFQKWLRPFRDLKADTVTLRSTGGTDHRSFQAVGLPGFQFIQDGLDYRARLHHTNIDVIDHVQEADLKQASVVLAAVLYYAAQRPDKLPRKAMPRRPTAREEAERAKADAKAKRKRDRERRRSE